MYLYGSWTSNCDLQNTFRRRQKNLYSETCSVTAAARIESLVRKGQIKLLLGDGATLKRLYFKKSNVADENRKQL